MSWLGVVAQVLAIAVAASVLMACAVQVGQTPDGKGLYSRLDIQPLPPSAAASSQPEILPPLSPPQPLQQPQARASSDYTARTFIPD